MHGMFENVLDAVSEPNIETQTKRKNQLLQIESTNIRESPVTIVTNWVQGIQLCR